MSNIDEHTITAVNRIKVELVPPALAEDLFYAAIAVAWSADSDLYKTDCGYAAGNLCILQKLASDIAKYSVPVDRADDPA